MVPLRFFDSYGTASILRFLWHRFDSSKFFISCGTASILIFLSLRIFIPCEGEISSKPFVRIFSLSLAFFILHIFVSQFIVSANHVYALAILISSFHYSKNVSAIDQVKLFQFSVFGSSQLVSLKSKGDIIRYSCFPPCIDF